MTNITILMSFMISKMQVAMTTAVVKIAGTDLEVKTDLDGNFTIDGLMPGDYNLEVSYISYKETKVVKAVSSDSNRHLKLSLKSE